MPRRPWCCSTRPPIPPRRRPTNCAPRAESRRALAQRIAAVPRGGFPRRLRGVSAATIGDRATPMARAAAICRSRCAPRSSPTRQRHAICQRIYGLGGKDFYAADAEQFFAQAIETVIPGASPNLRLSRRHARRAGRGARPGCPHPGRRRVARHGESASRRGDKPARGRAPPAVENDGGAEPRCAGPRRLPWLRHLPDAAPGLTTCSRAMLSCCSRPAAPWSSRPATHRPRTASTMSTTCSRTARRRSPGWSRCITSACGAASCRLEGHHLRDDQRRRRHGHRHGPGDRCGQPQPPDDDPGVRQPGLHEHRRAALYSTPFGHRTSTSEVGTRLPGKRYHHKDTAQIFAASPLPYVFTASEGYPET